MVRVVFPTETPSDLSLSFPWHNCLNLPRSLRADETHGGRIVKYFMDILRKKGLNSKAHKSMTDQSRSFSIATHCSALSRKICTLPSQTYSQEGSIKAKISRSSSWRVTFGTFLIGDGDGCDFSIPAWMRLVSSSIFFSPCFTYLLSFDDLGQPEVSILLRKPVDGLPLRTTERLNQSFPSREKIISGLNDSQIGTISSWDTIGYGSVFSRTLFHRQGRH